MAEFRDCFRTVRVEISRLISDSPDRIFGTIFGPSWTVLRFVLIPRLMSSGLGCLFCDEMMYGCMEPNRFLFVEGP